MAAGYCGEKTVEAFLSRVGKDYPAPVVRERGRRIWLKRDLDLALGLAREVDAGFDAADAL
jgi:hypothetical protein